MMMKWDMSFAVELIALVMGAKLLMKVCKEEVCCKLFYKIIGYFVVIASMILILCTAFQSYKMMERKGEGPMKGMHSKMMMDPAMHEKMMKECPMMKKMMEEMEGHGEEHEGK